MALKEHTYIYICVLGFCDTWRSRASVCCAINAANCKRVAYHSGTAAMQTGVLGEGAGCRALRHWFALQDFKPWSNFVQYKISEGNLVAQAQSKGQAAPPCSGPGMRPRGSPPTCVQAQQADAFQRQTLLAEAAGSHETAAGRHKGGRHVPYPTALTSHTGHVY